MPFTLIPPGQRKGNPFYLARGIHPITGRDVEISTKTRDKAAARQFAREVWQGLATSGPPRPGEVLRFRRAVELYCEYRGIDLNDKRLSDARRLRMLNAVIGDTVVTDIRQPTLVAAANQLSGNRTPATRNREVIRPAAAVLHYVADSGYCEWRRIKLFKEPQPVTRAVSQAVAMQLLAAAPEGRKRLVLLWLFRQGTRISQTLAVTWDDISLADQTFGFYDKKSNQWQHFPLHPEVFEELCRIPEAERQGRLWPWTQKTGVYKWLRPLAKDLGIIFTPHMGRHSLGTWLNASGAGLKTIMATLGHKDVKSSVRYQAADIEMVRSASKKLGELAGNPPESRRKSS